MSNYSHIFIGSYDLLEKSCIDDATDCCCFFVKQIDSMLLCVCSQSRHQKYLVRTSVKHSATASYVTFFVLIIF